MSPRDPGQLLAAGQLAEAAETLQARGEHARAADLLEQVWDFASASWAARAAGDLPRALGNALRARDQVTAGELVEQAVAEGGEALERCAEICEDRGALVFAARLLEARGDLAAATDCHQRAGSWLAAARCHDSLGDARAAITAFQRHLGMLEQDDAPDGAAAAAVPRYELGRLLLRYGRTEEALPLLQQAWKEGGEQTGPRAGRAVVAALARLGYDHGAEVARGLLPPGSPDVRSCLEDPELALVGGEGEGRVLAGRYRLGELLGSGGMGSVYIGTDLLTEQRVAVKIFTAPGGARGRDAYLRFVREARTTGELRHPHIVSLLDFNEEMGFMVLEHMAGGTLARRLTPAMELAACRTTMLQLLSGLTAAHQRGVVHRDIKPSNIFYTSAGAAKLGDFGVAHLQDTGQTQTGAFIGTLAYMSPEQISGAPVSFATDIYALGVTLFLMVTGQLPFRPPDLIGQHMRAPVPRPSQRCPDLPVMVDQVVLRCMAKPPEDRYRSLGELRQAVERFPQESESVSVAGVQQAAKKERPRRATDQRFTVESQVLSDRQLQVLEARDNDLGRPVVLVRLAKTERRQPLLALLGAAASRGGVTLQRVLALDCERGQAVLQSMLPEPCPRPSGRRQALRLCEDLGRALAPLHDQQLAHGAVTGDAVSSLGSWILLDLVAALTAPPGATVEDDVQAVLSLAGLAQADAPGDGAALARWARQQTDLHEQQRRRLIRKSDGT